jgi:hypothetical protein
MRPSPAAVHNLLRAIYMEDDHAVLSELASRPLSEHIVRAATRHKVVPLALVLCKASVSVREAGERLAAQPVLRAVVQQLVGS